MSLYLGFSDKRIFFLAILMVVGACSSGTGVKGKSYPEYKKDKYTLLDTALQNRKDQLISYLSGIQEKAAGIRKDPFCRDFFKIMAAFQKLQKAEELTPQAMEKTQTLMDMFKKHYIRNYNCFYDVLFVDPKGKIFYTIRRQNDYQKNIFEGQLNDTALSRKMRSFPSESFVDFQFYKISGEPSAFFIEPVHDNNNTFQGWMVLQFAINKINNMFSHEEDLGATGEVFLVNHDHYMLTDSRFRTESTILRKQLADENISSKFAAKSGHKEVIDYRGQRVISSFAVFDFLDSHWLIIAKMDKAEIFTDYYLQHPHKLQQAMEQICLDPPVTYTGTKHFFYNGIEVDMDEFRRSDDAQPLYTHGIATCTAFVVNYPENFTYLAHISPYDKVYNKNRTDLIAHMLKKIEYLEITSSEKHTLRFYLISPTSEAFFNIVCRLLDHGYFLSQIKCMNNPDAVHADIKSVAYEDEVLVNWKITDQACYLERGSQKDALQHQLNTVR